MQKWLDRFHQCRKKLLVGLAYLSMRLFGLEVQYSDVWQGSYSNRQHVDRDLGNASDVNGLLEVAKHCLHMAQSQRSSVIEKCKTLLTVSSLLLALIGVLLPKFSSIDALWMRSLLFLAILALLNTVILLLTFFDVGREMGISLDQTEVDLGAEDLTKNLVNLYLRCQNAIDNRTDYLVDVFATSRFFFLSAFSIIVFLFSVNFLLGA